MLASAYAAALHLRWREFCSAGFCSGELELPPGCIQLTVSSGRCRKLNQSVPTQSQGKWAAPRSGGGSMGALFCGPSCAQVITPLQLPIQHAGYPREAAASAHVMAAGGGEATPLMLQRRVTAGNAADRRPPGVPKTKPIVLIDEGGGALYCGYRLPRHLAMCALAIGAACSSCCSGRHHRRCHRFRCCPTPGCPPACPLSQATCRTPPCASRRWSPSCRWAGRIESMVERPSVASMASPAATHAGPAATTAVLCNHAAPLDPPCAAAPPRHPRAGPSSSAAL